MPKVSLNLTGKWEFKEYPLSARRMRDLNSADWQQTNVPCSIFTSLISAGQIKQSDIDTDPENFSYVSEKPWIYRKLFDVPEELLDCDRIDLVFDGLDTIASIWLNDKLIGKTNNMFIPFRFDATAFLKRQNNSLLVKFESATQYAKRLMNRYTQFGESDFRNPYRAYIRKAQYQFGWDFCPALAGCGIWRPVRLEGIKKAGLEDLHIRTINCNLHQADIKIEVKLDTISREEFACWLTISGPSETIKHRLSFQPGEEHQSTVVYIKKPFLWWPAGYGPQNLYKIDAQLLSDGVPVDQIQKRFAIRTVKLNQLSDELGEKFQFEMNGQPTFARGANWIPASIFAGSITTDHYEELLHAAAKSNINMLRVWGGGYYEADEFYQLCDRLGIMVWQDFMFACAYYPDRHWFIEQVKNEAIHIIKRLRNHPCMVLWCGNNEIDWMHNTGRLGRSKKFYGKAIYHQILPKLVSELHHDGNYIPTTPLVKKDKSKTDLPLTAHQWDIWSGHQPVRQYLCLPENVPPFVTEFGLQSLPDMETIKTFCSQGQLHIAGRTLEKHNYQLDGNSRLHRYMADLFGTAENLEQFVYLSQVTQARAVKIYVEYLRAHNRRNSGVLFWQLNDCCPAISWSAIDHRKKPKALYYYTKRFFSKLLITAIPEPAEAKAGLLPEFQPTGIVAINDGEQPLTATVNCRLIDLFGSVRDQVTLPIAIAPFSTSARLKLPRAIAFPDNPDKSALHLVMERDGERIAENLVLYLPDKYIDWPEPEISTELCRITDRQWKLRLKSNVVVKDVQIASAVPAQFSDNFTDLIPPDIFEITITCKQQMPVLESKLHLRTFKSVF